MKITFEKIAKWLSNEKKGTEPNNWYYRDGRADYGFMIFARLNVGNDGKSSNVEYLAVNNAATRIFYEKIKEGGEQRFDEVKMSFHCKPIPCLNPSNFFYNIFNDINDGEWDDAENTNETAYKMTRIDKDMTVNEYFAYYDECDEDIDEDGSRYIYGYTKIIKDDNDEIVGMYTEMERLITEDTITEWTELSEKMKECDLGKFFNEELRPYMVDILNTENTKLYPTLVAVPAVMCYVHDDRAIKRVLIENTYALDYNYVSVNDNNRYESVNE